jgi:hypothetical protein
MSTSSYTVDFTTEAEARDFLAHEKEQLEVSGFEYLDSSVWYSEDNDVWFTRIEYSQYGEAA